MWRNFKKYKSVAFKEMLTIPTLICFHGKWLLAISIIQEQKQWKYRGIAFGYFFLSIIFARFLFEHSENEEASYLALSMSNNVLFPYTPHPNWAFKVQVSWVSLCTLIFQAMEIMFNIVLEIYFMQCTCTDFLFYIKQYASTCVSIESVQCIRWVHSQII